MEGARIQANANGTAFYAVVNKSLYAGRSVANSVLVREVSVDPPFQEIKPEVVENAFHAIAQVLDEFSADANVLDAARRLQPQLQEGTDTLSAQRVTIIAKVAYPEGHPPKSVSVDLSRLGLSARSSLLAGGYDRESGEGLYRNVFSFDSIHFKDQQYDWRTCWSGIRGLTVTAVGDDGTLAGAVGILGVRKQAQSIPFCPATWFAAERETGSVKGTIVRPRGTAHTGSQLELSVLKAGQWSARIDGPREGLDLSAFYAISFLLHANRETTDDVAVQLRDHPTYALPATTNPVYLVKSKLLRKITTAPQRVVVPLSQLSKDSPDFQPGLTHQIIVSGNASGPIDYNISQVRCYPLPDAIPAEEATP